MKIKKLFKKKSFKLSLVFLSLVGMLASGGHSFAKYRDENHGNGNAGAARFGIELVYYPKTISTKDIRSTNKLGYYAFVASFYVSFEECEVKTKYSLSLKLGNGDSATWTNPGTLNRTSFLFPDTQSHPFALVEQDDNSFLADTDSTAVASLLNKPGFAVKKNTPYYAEGVSSGGSINYTWKDDKTLDGNTFPIVTEKLANPNERQYYQILFFTDIELNNVNKVNVEDISILYNINAEQVGGE